VEEVQRSLVPVYIYHKVTMLFYIMKVKLSKKVNKYFQGATYQKSQSAVSMVPKKVSLQLFSKQSAGKISK